MGVWVWENGCMGVRVMVYSFVWVCGCVGVWVWCIGVCACACMGVWVCVFGVCGSKVRDGREPDSSH